jgi:hypothetical protein
VQQNGFISTIIAEKLKEILYEDPRFDRMISLFLTESTDYANIVKPYY